MFQIIYEINYWALEVDKFIALKWTTKKKRKTIDNLVGFINNGQQLNLHLSLQSSEKKLFLQIIYKNHNLLFRIKIFEGFHKILLSQIYIVVSQSLKQVDHFYENCKKTLQI